MPYNGLSGRPYRGINTFLLMIVAETQGYVDQEWYTFNNAKTLGARVKKGEHGTEVVFWKKYPMKTMEDNGQGELELVTKNKSFLRYWRVFNRSQLTGLPPKEEKRATLFLDDRVRQLEAMAKEHSINIRYGSHQAAWSPVTDIIQMPHKTEFLSPTMFANTLSHEMTHWTGHKSRLDRANHNFFGDSNYAKEELVAELGSSFVMAELQIDKEPATDGLISSASYLKSWLDVLKADKKAIFMASSHARRATDFLFKREVEKKEEVA